MKIHLRIIVIAAALLFAASGCKSQYDVMLESSNVDEKYKAAFEYFNAGKYSKAASLFESMAILTNGTERDDTVQFYWGLSNYRFRDYYTAETNFSKFIETFPRSPFAEEARFLRIDCLYRSTYRWELDQLPTRSAMNEMVQYLKDYPGSKHDDEVRALYNELDERLDKKAFESARLYYKMEDYKAARVAFKNILKDDADNIYREDILYYIAKSSYRYAALSVRSKQKERYLTFIDDYLNFIGEMPESPYCKELEDLYGKARKEMDKI